MSEPMQAPILDKLYAFCDIGDVGDLKALIGQTDINIYDNETGGSPLNNNVLLLYMDSRCLGHHLSFVAIR